MMSSLLRNKTGPLLVALQIAVTLAIVVNSLYIVLQRVDKMNRDTGMDVDNVIIIYVRGFGEDFDVANSIANDIDLIKSIPGVVAATVSNHVPLSGSGSAPHCALSLMRRLTRSLPGVIAGAKKDWTRWALNCLAAGISFRRKWTTSCQRPTSVRHHPSW
jgi:hypothetical protein